MNFKSIRPETIRGYIQTLHDRGESSSTVAKKLRSVDKFLDWAHGKGFIDTASYQQIRPLIANYLSSATAEQRGNQRGKTRNTEQARSEARMIIDTVPSIDQFESANKIKSFIFGILKRIPLLNIKNVGAGSPDPSTTRTQNMKGAETASLQELSPQQYVAFTIVIIFLAVLGAGLYNQFFNKSPRTFAYPIAPVTAGRILSFQGRLTDSTKNPINSAVNVDFRLYNAPAAGTMLYDTGACSITPDTDGIFSVLIGGSGYSPTPPQSVCGSQIDPSVFTENANVYMSIQVASDAEMTPRQQIANVGYAMNAATLQGLPPGGNTSNVPFINKDGDLLLAAAAPGIRSTATSATFALTSAAAVTIQSASTGDIILNASESGNLRLQTAGSDNLYVKNGGNVGIGTTSPVQTLDVRGNITTGNSIGNKIYTYYASATNNNYIGNDSTGSLTFATGVSGVSERMRIDQNGNVGIGTTTPLNKLDVNGSAAIGSLPANALPQSNELYVSGNVGIGTTGPSQKLHVYQNSTANLTSLVENANTSYNSNLELKASRDWLVQSLGTLGANSGAFGIYDSTATAYRMLIDSSGNVGIGTISPAYKLDVKGSGSIGSAVFTGTGLNDATSGGTYTGTDTTAQTYTVVIDATGTPDTFKWQKGAGSWTTGVAITGSAQTLTNGVTITFGATTGHTLNDQWVITATPINIFSTLAADGTTRGLTVLNNGNVGIGTTAPANKLEVSGNSDITGNLGIGTTAPLDKLDVNGSVAIGSLPANALPQSNELYVSGNVGIGVTSPTQRLDVGSGSINAEKYYDNSDNTRYLDPAGMSYINMLHSYAQNTDTNWNMILEDNTPGGPTNGPTITAASGSTLIINSTATPSATLCVNTTYSSGVANCDGKIDAGTIDPPYVINGEKYATYNPSMTGVKEETTGTVAVNEHVAGVGYRHIINFNNADKASDLWLFAKVTNLRNTMQNLIPLLTPTTNARTWYTVDPANFQLVIYASRPTVVSYRLTAPRFDYAQWKNTRSSSDVGGLTINDPDMSRLNVDSSGNVSTPQLVYDGNLNNNGYTVKFDTGTIVDDIGAYAQAVIGKLTAGLVNAQNIVTDSLNVTSGNITIAGKSLQDYIDNRIRAVLGSQSVVSPIAETKDIVATGSAQLNKIQTNEIAPQNGDLTINLQPTPNSLPPNDKGKLAKIIIRGLNNATVASIDAAGNASFSGTLSAQNATISGTLVAQSATVSGTLVAQNVRSENINQLENNVASQSSSLDTLSSNVNDIQSLLAKIQNQPLPNANYYQNITLGGGSKITDGSSSSSNPPSSILDLKSDSLTVTGQSNLYNVSVAGSMLIGQTFIENNSILSLASDLKLSAFNTITLFDGGVVIARDGTITTKGEIIAQGLQIKNPVGDTVASIDASGSAQFNNLTINNLAIGNKYMDATSSAAVIAAPDNLVQNGINAPAIETKSQSAGVGILPANSTEILIYNSSVKADSLIYITPTTPGSPPLTVSQKIVSDKPYFIITIDKPVINNIQFNWLIIN